MKQPVIGFIGGGNMATSLIGGLIQSGYEPQNIWVSDHNLDKRKRQKEQFQVQTSASNIEVLKCAEILVLAIKPQHAYTVVQELKDPFKTYHPLIVSIVTGVKTTHLERWFGTHTAIVRVMPNTPVLLRTGASGLYANLEVTEEQKSLAESLLRAVGITVWVNHEKDLDAITALSGSGPAYFFLIMEAIQSSGEALGLSPAIAKLLTLQTALGAARMGLESDLNLEELRQRVTSIGGTTEQALRVLESGGLRDLLNKAIQAAKERAIEISAQFDKET